MQSPVTRHHEIKVKSRRVLIPNLRRNKEELQRLFFFANTSAFKRKKERIESFIPRGLFLQQKQVGGIKPNRYNPLKRNKGLSIIEALAAAFIGGVVLAGTGKMIGVSLHSSNAVKSSTAEQSLVWAMSKVLTDTLQCKANLKPGSGGISTTNGKGTISELIQGLNDPNVEDTTLVKVGGTFKNVLEIVKMEFTGSGTGDPKTSTVIRDFIVYYKKKGVGTLENKPCDSTNVEGCYFQGCSLKYKLENNANPNVEVCDVQNCVGSAGGNYIVGISCGSGKYLKGFDSNGNKVCEVLGECSSGEYLKGFDSNGNKVCEVLGECSSGEYLKGFDSNGNKVCLNKSTLIGSQTCPSGQYLGGFDSNGIKVCHNVPTSPTSPTSVTSTTPSPTRKPYRGGCSPQTCCKYKEGYYKGVWRRVCVAYKKTIRLNNHEMKAGSTGYKCVCVNKRGKIL
ncbi:MAG: hypothetical protein OXM55_04635 [Bdellovibrionales bacterium]|nr:hypothetical protein [Bdellovibrionales bacterium]